MVALAAFSREEAWQGRSARQTTRAVIESEMDCTRSFVWAPAIVPEHAVGHFPVRTVGVGPREDFLNVKGRWVGSIPGSAMRYQDLRDDVPPGRFLSPSLRAESTASQVSAGTSGIGPEW